MITTTVSNIYDNNNNNDSVGITSVQLWLMLVTRLVQSQIYKQTKYTPTCAALYASYNNTSTHRVAVNMAASANVYTQLITMFPRLQLGSDTSSIRSYGSNIGSYKSPPDTNRWRSSSYAAPRDSSLAFATLNRGYVSSLKDRFSTPTAGDRRMSLSRSLSGGRDYRYVAPLM